MSDKQTLDVWGGFECSVVRIGSAYRNQSDETGHAARLDDIDRAHALGLRTLRYPALWETIAPDDPERCDWRWHDQRFDRLRRLGMRPIAGLAHHGSGPRYTHLLDPAFPELMERHAERVARRYPWIEDWTPVNEPLTTARFSALYGHWYPHRSDMRSFLRATVTQCAATVLAMRAVRRVNPAARLIQTEDIGKTFSTPELDGQARFENQRRWLTLDLLCGRVDRRHPWWAVLSHHGIAPADLDVFLAGEGAPDIIGVNHYLTSERFLDADWRRYPAAFKGGNGVQDYADVEAVRVELPAADLGCEARLREVIERYARPVAVTEVHHGCSREEQLRWLAEVWDAATTLKAEGSDVRAVTIWSLAGAVDWNSLLVARRGIYEPGAFDVRAPSPRRTALGKAVASLAQSGAFTHPVLGAGWWRRPERLYHGAGDARTARCEGTARPLLITGGADRLSQAFARICEIRGLPHIVADGASNGVGNARSLRALQTSNPWAVLDLAGVAPTFDLAETEAISIDCARRGISLVAFSSALVFDGRLDRAHGESDVPTPLDEGALAVDLERTVMALHPTSLVVRTGPLFGILERRGDPGIHPAAFRLDPSTLVSPTFVPDLAHAALDLLIDGERGLWHLANAGAVSWGAFVSRLRGARNAPGSDAGAASDGGLARNLTLTSEKAWIMPTLDDAMARFALERRVPQPEAQPRIAAE